MDKKEECVKYENKFITGNTGAGENRQDAE